MTGRRWVWVIVLDAVVLLPLLGAVLSPLSARVAQIVNLSAGLGLLATSAMAVTVVLVSRLRGLTRVLGIELGNDLHRRIGIAVVVLTIAHVVAAVAAEPADSPMLDFWAAGDAVHAGSSAVLVMLVIGAVVPRPGSRWYSIRDRLHALLALLVLLLVALHIGLLGRLVSDPLVGVPLALLGLLVLAVVVRRWVLGPVLDRGAYVVRGVRPESATTSTVALEPATRPRTPRAEPGQFVWLRLRRGLVVGREHPFTVAASTRGGGLEVTIRTHGRFTHELCALEPGRRVWVDGPHGAFVPSGPAAAARAPEDRAPDNGLILIAGGVGITPIMSILRAHAAAGDHRTHRVLLAERQDEGLFSVELRALTRRLDLAVTRTEGRRVDAHLLGTVLPDTGPERHDYFVCGPPRLVSPVLDALDLFGVPGERIHTEQFG